MNFVVWVLLYLFNVIEGSLTSDEKQLLLDTHNDFRKTVLPVASNMVELVWDIIAAEVSQNWAEQCVFDGDPHNPNLQTEYRDLGGSDLVGENLAHWSGPFPITHSLGTMWDEHLLLPGGMNDPDWGSITHVAVGHYTQMAWAETTGLGCGLHSDCPEKPNWTILVCNYVPAGNRVGEAPYREGPACSECPQDFEICSDGLCSAGTASPPTGDGGPGGPPDREDEPFFIGPLTADIPGLGIDGGFDLMNRNDCEDLCIENDNCQAIQWSQSCRFGCDSISRCLLHDNIELVQGMVEDYDVYLLRRPEAGPMPCYTAGLSNDIPGFGNRLLGSSTLEECQDACSIYPYCVAIQYSEDCGDDCDKNCLFHSTQDILENDTPGYLTYLPFSCESCCFSAPLATDIRGLGFRAVPANLRSDCEDECCGTRDCLSIQYSPSCAMGDCDLKCLLHNSQDTKIGNPLYEDYRVSLAGPCDSDCCISNAISADISGFGFSAFEASSLSECQTACCRSVACSAVQYSEQDVLGKNVNCLLHSHQNTNGEIYEDYFTYFVGPKSSPTEPQCDGCCFSNSAISGDIAGLGYAAFEVDSLDDCKSACCASQDCKAIQFSEECSLECSIRCILHRSSAITGELVDDYFVHIREATCTSSDATTSSGAGDITNEITNSGDSDLDNMDLHMEGGSLDDNMMGSTSVGDLDGVNNEGTASGDLDNVVMTAGDIDG